MNQSRYAVIGDPIEHSRSPQIHRLFAEQTGQALHYTAVRVESAAVAEFVQRFFADGGAGLNVTVPHKESAYALAQCRSTRAELAKAVNTLYLNDEGKLSGDNTDGAGLIRDLVDNHAVTIAGKSVLMLGAGGAARGVLGPLIEQRPASISILNRTLSRARSLAQDFTELLPLAIEDYASYEERPFDLIVNATSMSLSGEVPPLSRSSLATGGCCYDMMYGADDTAFVRWAKSAGARLALDGLGMLVEQAAEAFMIWRGVRPQTAPVIASLRGV